MFINKTNDGKNNLCGHRVASFRVAAGPSRTIIFAKGKNANESPQVHLVRKDDKRT